MDPLSTNIYAALYACVLLILLQPIWSLIKLVFKIVEPLCHGKDRMFHFPDWHQQVIMKYQLYSKLERHSICIGIQFLMLLLILHMSALLDSLKILNISDAVFCYCRWRARRAAVLAFKAGSLHAHCGDLQTQKVQLLPCLLVDQTFGPGHSFYVWLASSFSAGGVFHLLKVHRNHLVRLN
jgi:hypothetical protein